MSKPKKDNRPRCIAAFGDTHTNFRLGLLAPGFAIDDGSDEAHVRSWLWARWLEYAALYEEVSSGCKRVVYITGDSGEFDHKKRSNLLVSTNRKEIKDMALATLAPLTDIADEIIVIGGTEAHAGTSAEFEQWIADDLGATFKWYDYANWGGVIAEVSHHTTNGRRKWTNGGGAVRLAAETIIEYAGNGDKIPQLVLRSHVHQWSDSGDNVPGCRAITMGSWCFAGPYVHKLDHGRDIAHIGGVIVRCEKGQANVTKFWPKPKREPPREI